MWYVHLFLIILEAPSVFILCLADMIVIQQENCSLIGHLNVLNKWWSTICIHQTSCGAGSLHQWFCLNLYPSELWRCNNKSRQHHDKWWGLLLIKFLTDYFETSLLKTSDTTLKNGINVLMQNTAFTFLKMPMVCHME